MSADTDEVVTTSHGRCRPFTAVAKPVAKCVVVARPNAREDIPFHHIRLRMEVVLGEMWMILS